MADRSAIEWTDASWNPIRARYWEIQGDGSGKERIGWHCEHASDGCRNCYAERMNIRLGTGMEFKPGNLYRDERKGYNNGSVKLFLDDKMLLAPLRWKKPRMIFVCSMTDLFADFVSDEDIDKVFAVMALRPQHTFQVLTKRPERMRDYCSDANRLVHIHDKVMRSGWLTTESLSVDRFRCAFANWPSLQNAPLPNVWLGVSCERQQEADERIPHLLNTPTAIRFVSAEPLLGPIDFTKVRGSINVLGRGSCPSEQDANGYHTFLVSDGLDWVIVGGESGLKARPMHPQWVRDIGAQCAAAGVAFFFKQFGEWAPGSNPDLNGEVRVVFNDGRTCGPSLAASRAEALEHGWGGRDPHMIRRVGKKRAGRLLDGKEHSEFPKGVS